MQVGDLVRNNQPGFTHLVGLVIKFSRTGEPWVKKISNGNIIVWSYAEWEVISGSQSR